MTGSILRWVLALLTLPRLGEIVGHLQTLMGLMSVSCSWDLKFCYKKKKKNPEISCSGGFLGLTKVHADGGLNTE